MDEIKNASLRELSAIPKEPTPEDIAKELSTDELKLLCQRTKVHVDMWKWNPVEDFASVFREQGRFVAQSQKFINKLLLKAYRKRSHYFKEVEEEKEKEKEFEWQKRKKESLLRLNQWRYDEEQRLRDSEIETIVAPEYDPIELEVSQSEELENVVDVPQNNSWENRRKEILKSREDRFEGELDVVINSESMTVNTESITISEMVSEPMVYSTVNVSLDVSQIQDEPVLPYESEPQSQEEDYNNFEERLPLASTQDSVC